MTLVRAAGGIVWRRGPDGIELVLVHHAGKADWSFPKGKLGPGEDEPTAALREVHEETGLVAGLGEDLGTVGCRDARGRPKLVRYYAMRVHGDDVLRPGHEIDDARWVPLERAGEVLTHEHDRRFLGQVETPALRAVP